MFSLQHNMNKTNNKYHFPTSDKTYYILFIGDEGNYNHDDDGEMAFGLLLWECQHDDIFKKWEATTAKMTNFVGNR